ncbi:MAG: S-layer homology domain-containing protein [Evtepia gabavorous]|uniref:S-layer homology domain-containing protein n=4 Tax=Evtepia gabavorous TaxID=2211183 RepID=A0A3E2B0L0_9FIRM|nr:S-layer homology domain-containing protein [Evtepia gabavorous]RFT05588.1 S-layer homology domain-containing protein [Evtepia gabavorous]TYK61817.1 hypothetical protein DLJ88_11850 [Evtepia gabavorous]
MRKRLLSWVLLFALALSLLPMGTLAAEETQSWQEAYREYIQSDLENTAGSGYLDGAKEETRYFLFDVNEDSIPELWINYSTSAYGKRLCSYANRQVQVQNVAYGELSYIPGQSLVFTSGGHMGYFWDTVYHLENGNFKIAEEGLIKIVDNNGYEVSENEYRYTWNNQVVDKSTYESKLGAAFDTLQAVNPPQDGGLTYQEVLNALNTSKTPPETLYRQIIDKYKTGVDEKWTIQEFSENNLAYVCGYRPEHVGYAFMDLDGNGVKELIIGDTEYGIDGVIYALYSYADGSIKEVFSSGERDRHSLCDGGIILNDWSNSAWNNGRAYYRISGTTLSLKERIVGDKDKNGNYVQFYSTTENDQDLISITEEKAQEIRDSYVKESIQYTSFSEYNPDAPGSEDAANALQEQFIKEHIEYATSKNYKQDIVMGYSNYLLSILEESQKDASVSGYNLLNGLNNGLNLDFELNDVDMYELILSELLYSEQSRDGLQSMYQENFVNSAILVLTKILENASIKESLGDAVFNLLKNKLAELEKAADDTENFISVFDTIIDILNDSTSKESLVDSLKNSSLPLEISIDGLQAVCTSAKDIVEYIVAGSAYANTQEEFVEVLTILLGYSGQVANNGWDIFVDIPAMDRVINSSALCSALNNFITRMEKYKQDNITAVAEYSVQVLGNESHDFMVDSIKKIALKGTDAMLSLVPVLSWAVSIRESLGIGLSLVEIVTNVDETAYAADMITKYYCLAVLMNKTVDGCKGGLLSEDSDAIQFKAAVIFDQSINMYKSVIKLASDYAVKYETEKLKTAIRQDSISTHSFAISLAMTQKILCDEIRCHSVGLEYDPSSGTVFYNTSALKVYTIACPVDAIVKTDSGKQIAHLSNSGNIVTSGYEQYCFTVENEANSSDKIKVIVVPTSYQVTLKGTDNGIMDAYVVNITNDKIEDVSAFYEVPITNGAEGTFVPSQQNDKVANLIFDGKTYKPTVGEVPDQPVPTEPFADVSRGDWFYEAVQYVYDKGMMTGVSADRFAPASTTTRGMIVTILYRLENEPAVSGGSAFTDVENGAWYADAVAWAAANDIVNGTSATTFAPNSPITREQMAAILYRYAAYKGYDVSQKADLSGYTDAASISGYAKDALAWANAQKLITGVTDTTLNPQGSATRAQVATILMRLCETVVK